MSNLGEIPGVLNVLLLDSDGKRVAVRYYDSAMKTTAAQMKFEKEVFSKTSSATTRAATRRWRCSANHLVVLQVLRRTCTSYVTAKRRRERAHRRDGAERVLRRGEPCCSGGWWRSATALENLDLVLLTIDELVDGGIILETDPRT